MSKHTPGPWEWGWKDDPDNPGSVVAVGPPNDPRRPYAVAMCPRYRGRDRAQHSWEADARLIATAPDLLEAAVAVEAMYADDSRTKKYTVDHPMTRLRKAIAKAKGDNE